MTSFLPATQERVLEGLVRAVAGVNEGDVLSVAEAIRIAFKLQLVEEEQGAVIWVCTHHVDGNDEHVLVGVRLMPAASETLQAAPIMPSGTDRLRVGAVLRDPCRYFGHQDLARIASLLTSARQAQA